MSVRCPECIAEGVKRARKCNCARRHPRGRCHTHHVATSRQSSIDQHTRHIAETYGGLTRYEYDRMYEYQGGKCAICRRAKGIRRRLSVDHDHSTGLVRMLLCSPCNKYLGHARDDPEFFQRCIDLLNNPTAKQLGITRYGKKK